MFNYSNIKSNKGFTIFFAMLVGGLALAVGIAIYDLTVRELDLSGTATQSQYAIYAADTGAECALYWDTRSVAVIEDVTSVGAIRQYVFATSSGSSVISVIPNSDIKCFNGVDITDPPWNIAYGNSPDSAVTTFELKDADLTKPCVIVEVSKIDTGGGVFSTTIDSRGRSSCDSNPRRVERGLKVSY